MTFDLVIIIATAIINAGLAIAVYVKAHQSAVARVFLCACVSIVVWVVANFYIDFAATERLSLISTHVTMVAGFNILFWLALFAFLFGGRRQIQKKWLPCLTIYYVAMSLVTISPWVTEGIVYGQGKTEVLIGSAYWLYVATLAGLAGLTGYFLWQTKRRSSALIAAQIQFILLGVSVSVGLAALTNLVLPVLTESWELARLGPLFTVFFTGSVAYSMIKYRLFDIRLIAARSMTYLLVLLTMGGAYSLVVFSLVDQLFAGSQMGLAQRLVYMLAAMLLAFTFQPLKRFFDRVTDRVFFRSRYSLEDLVADVTNHTASTLDLTLLAERTLRRVTDGMRVERASLWAVEEGDFYCAAYRNMELSDLERVEPELLLDMVGEVKHSVIVAEEVGGRFGRCLHRWQVEIAVPLLASGSLQGVILLGNKQSGDMYTDQDINALRIIGPSLAIGLENAASYKRIQEFNQTLAQEVDKATYELTVANEKLSRSNAKLRQLDSLKDEFISITSHELRTPLTAIRGYLWMAMHRQEAGGQRPEAEAEYLERAYISTERLIDLVNDSLDISRIDSGRVQLTPEPTDLGRLVEEVTTDLRPRVEQQRQRLVIVKPKVALPAVMVDPEKLYQVLTNLVGNAIKFTPDGGEIRVSFERQKGGVVTRIADTGPGISAEDQKRLFQKFSRLDAAATIPGTGLGLFLCREIIRLSKGKIWVESEVGQGTAFVFSLPATRRKAASPDGQKRHAQRLISAAAR